MNRLKPIIVSLSLFCLVVVVAVSVFRTLSTTPTAHQTEYPPYGQYTISSVEPLSPMRPSSSYIFVKVQDPNGKGVNGVFVKIQWAELNDAIGDNFILGETKTETNLLGETEDGRFWFKMFKGPYWVQLVDGVDGISGIVGPLEVGGGKMEYEIIFTQHQ